MLEKLLDHPPERCDARAGCDEDVVMETAIDRQYESLARRTRHLNSISHLAVAQKVAAHAKEEFMIVRLFGLVLVDETLARGRDDSATPILPPGGRGDRVEPDGMGSTGGLLSGGNHAEGLTGMEVPRQRRARHIDGDVPDETRRAAAETGRRFDDGPDDRCPRSNEMHLNIWEFRLCHDGLEYR